jgi:hypothetical protein
LSSSRVRTTAGRLVRAVEQDRERADPGLDRDRRQRQLTDLLIRQRRDALRILERPRQQPRRGAFPLAQVRREANARHRRLDGDGRRGSMKPAGADRVRELNEDMAGNIGRGRRIQPLKAAAPKRLSAKEKGRGAAAFL